MHAKGYCKVHYGRARRGANMDGRLTLEQRVWRLVRKTGSGDCWEWQGRSRDHFGYGVLTVRNGRGGHTSARAHRVAYESVKGSIPADLIVRHTCDNPPCCNPAHLILGDKPANSRDRLVRGRYPRRLTVDEMLEIKNSNLAQGELASIYGVDPSHICRIRRYWTLETISIPRSRAHAERLVAAHRAESERFMA